MKAPVVCAFVLAGCGGKPPEAEPTPSCDAAAAALVATYDELPGLELAGVKLRQAFAASCAADGWAAGVRECAVRGLPACSGGMTPDQREKLRQRIAALANPALAKPAPVPPKDAIASPLPERGPDPDYPTPVSAGTDRIFTLEDPERGPRAPLAFAMPPRAQLAWATHVHCEDGIVSIACSAPRGAPDRVHWRVGRRGKDLVVAEQMRGEAVERTYVYTAKPDGAPVQRLVVDRYGAVESAVLFRDDRRYSARRRNGANALAGCGFMAYTLDARRQIEELRCLQWTGEPMRDTDGAAVRRFVRDPRGFVLEEARFAADGAPVSDRDGVHREVHELDDHGRTRVARYRDPAGRPVRSTDHCAGRRTDRDAHGAEARMTCLDADDRPTERVSRVAIIEYRHDARGCRSSVRHLSRDGAAAIDGLRVHGFDERTDVRCAVTSHRCLNIVEQPQPCGPGKPARYDYVRDPAGRVTSTKHYGPDGVPGGDPLYRVFETRDQRDDAGNLVGQSCYGLRSAPVTCGTTGFHARKMTYDDAGRQLTETFYGVDGGPTTNMGAAARRFRYDNYDHLHESQSFDDRGELVEVRGAATRRDLFDATHRRFGIVLLDKQGKPATYGGCYSGMTCPKSWHAVRIVRRANGSAEANKFFDAAGRLVETKACSAAPCFD